MVPGFPQKEGCEGRFGGCPAPRGSAATGRGEVAGRGAGGGAGGAGGGAGAAGGRAAGGRAAGRALS
ncbi:MAG: hypothetical protein ACJ8GN_17030, partial [Longimicrobiaceae bacterium]